MCVNVRALFVVAVMLVACGSPSQPTQPAQTQATLPALTPTATSQPSTGCGGEPTPADTPRRPTTGGPNSASPGATPSASASGEIRLAFAVYADKMQALTFATTSGDGSRRL